MLKESQGYFEEMRAKYSKTGEMHVKEFLADGVRVHH